METTTMQLRRWTPLIMARPHRYVSEDAFWNGFDLFEWAETGYEWTQDPWNGLRDFARRPQRTVSEGRGDCEDFALVAASWAVAQGRRGVGLGFCFSWPRPWPVHAIAYDDERIYSSGYISEVSVDEWLTNSKYDYCLRRPLS